MTPEQEQLVRPVLKVLRVYRDHKGIPARERLERLDHKAPKAQRVIPEREQLGRLVLKARRDYKDCKEILGLEQRVPLDPRVLLDHKEIRERLVRRVTLGRE